MIYGSCSEVIIICCLIEIQPKHSLGPSSFVLLIPLFSCDLISVKREIRSYRYERTSLVPHNLIPIIFLGVLDKSSCLNVIPK